MGIDLHPQVLAFFTARMQGHTRVQSCTRDNTTATEYIFEIKRTDGLPAVKVHLSDAYDYGLAEYLVRPRQVAFIVIARPEAGFDRSLCNRGRREGIGIGKIGKLMGALNSRDLSTYFAPDERPEK